MLLRRAARSGRGSGKQKAQPMRAVNTDTKPCRDLSDCVAAFSDLLDCRYLKFFGVPTSTHDHSFCLELWLRSVYKTRGDSKTSATQRPQFAALLGQIRNGETLVVAKLDRLGRDAQDVGATVKLLAARKIAVIVLLGKLNRTSPGGKMMLTMLAGVVEMERDLLVERTQASPARAKSEGKTLGRLTKTTVTQRADIVAKYAAGESVSAMARLYNISRANILEVVKSA